MKTLITILFFSLNLSYPLEAKPKPQNKEITILSDKHHIVYFKVSKSYLGGKVKICDEHQNIIETDSLSHTHTMIYFDKMPAGLYTVKVVKENKTLEFKYDSL